MRGRPRETVIIELTKREADIMMRALSVTSKLSFIAPSFAKQIDIVIAKLDTELNYEQNETTQETK